MADDVFRLELQRVAKGVARVFELAELKKDTAQIDARLAPIRLHFNHAVVEPHGVVDALRVCFALQRVLEKISRGSRVHLADIRGASQNVKWQKELAGQRLDGLAGASGRDRGDLAAAGE